MYVFGYSVVHTGDTTRIYDHKSSRIHTSKDVKWYFTNNRFTAVTFHAGKCVTNNTVEADIDLDYEIDKSINSTKSHESSKAIYTMKSESETSKDSTQADVKSIYEDNHDTNEDSDDEYKEDREHGEIIQENG